jgi:hypothetical protein
MSLGLSPFRAQAKLDDLPATPEAIKYLMALVNGSNPEIPPYMALGRLEQMKHEMEKEAPQPPQGTVKDKTMQAAGVMALQGGQQQHFRLHTQQKSSFDRLLYANILRRNNDKRVKNA